VVFIGKMVEELAPATIRIEKVAPVAPHGNRSIFDGEPLEFTNITPLTLLVKVSAYEPVVISEIL
jgi:hypothetical protein